MATPVAAREWLARLRQHTDKPVRYLVLSHYHAVRVLGASAFGAEIIVTHEKTRELIAERGRQDWESEYGRMPRLFEEPASIPGLTWPTATFTDRFTIDLGGDRGDLVLQYCGRGHTEGDIVAWLPAPADPLRRRPGRGPGRAVHRRRVPPRLGGRHAGPGRRAAARKPWSAGAARWRAARMPARLPSARPGTSSTPCCAEVGAVHERGGTLDGGVRRRHAALAERYGRWPIFEHCMPFNVSRLWDELSGIERPRIWTAERDREVWDELQG